jgi:hypothetical protein
VNGAWLGLAAALFVLGDQRGARQPSPDDFVLGVLEHPEGETESFELWRVDSKSATMILRFDAGGC